MAGGPGGDLREGRSGGRRKSGGRGGGGDFAGGEGWLWGCFGLFFVFCGEGRGAGFFVGWG